MASPSSNLPTTGSQSTAVPATAAIDDLAIMSALSAKDADALGQLYDRYSGIVYAMCLRALPHASAEEVVTDVFWELWERAERFDPSRGSAVGYLVGMTRSRILDKLRALGARKHQMSQPGASAARQADSSIPGPLEDAVLAEQRVRVRAALAQLPDSQRETMEMAFFDALSHSQIAQRTGEPLGTVKSRIRQGLLRLRDLLGGRAEA